MDVKDNGRGISAAEIADTRSLGLLGMKERAALLGGDFQIGPVRGGHGTKVTVRIPHSRRPEKTQHEDSVDRRSRRRAPRLETNSRR
jgi:signal transduction histidine kinase